MKSVVKGLFAISICAFAAACSSAPTEGASASDEGIIAPPPHVTPTSVCFGAGAGTSEMVARVTIAEGGERALGFAVQIGGHTIEVADDGRLPDEVAGDHVYSGIAHVSERFAAQSTCLDMTAVDPHAAEPSPGFLKPDLFGCTVKTVDCKPDCKSVIFRTRCLVCVQVEC